MADHSQDVSWEQSAVRAQLQCTVVYEAGLTRVDILQAPQHLVQEELMMLRCQVIICLDYLQCYGKPSSLRLTPFMSLAKCLTPSNCERLQDAARVTR